MANAGILLETGTNELEILELHIDEDDVSGGRVHNCFGINVAKVMQVIESAGFSHRQGASNPCFVGTIALRDLIIPVLDLSTWLALERKPHAHEVVIVTEFSKTVLGFLVSGVNDIHRVGWGEVAPIDGFMSRVAKANIVGLIQREGRFIQLLDLEQLVSELDPGIMALADQVGIQAGRPCTVLVAEDSPTIRLMVRKNLAAAGFTVQEANNGEEALRLLAGMKAQAVVEGKAISQFVDIIISDIEMPLMDGFSFTKTIKSDPMLRELPVMLYSSIITKELRHKGEAVGADDQIAKPDMPMMAERALKLIKALKQEA